MFRFALERFSFQRIVIGQNGYHDNIYVSCYKWRLTRSYHSCQNKTLSVWKVASHFDLSKSKNGAQRGFSPGIPVSPLLKYQPMV